MDEAIIVAPIASSLPIFCKGKIYRIADVYGDFSFLWEYLGDIKGPSGQPLVCFKSADPLCPGMFTAVEPKSKMQVERGRVAALISFHTSYYGDSIATLKRYDNFPTTWVPGEPK